MSEKKMLLPVVSEEVGFAIQAEYRQNKKYTQAIIVRLQEDNPCIVNFISQMALASKDPQYVAETAILVYRLLESQAEADKLNKGI